MDPPDAGKGLLPHRSFHLVPFSRLPLLPSVQIHKYRLDLFGTSIYSNLCPHLILFGGLRFQMFLSGLWLDFWKRETVETFNSRGDSDCICLLTFLNQRRTSGAGERGIFSSDPCLHGVAMSVRLTGSATPFWNCYNSGWCWFNINWWNQWGNRDWPG